MVISRGDDAEAHIRAGRTLLVAPPDEGFEAFDGGGRRRDEAADFLGRQQRQQPRRVRDLQFPQARRPVQEQRHEGLPLG
jgi:hypothetical protein